MKFISSLTFICLSMAAFDAHADECSDLITCLERIIGNEVETPAPGTAYDEFCTAMLKAYNGTDMCALADLIHGSGRRQLNPVPRTSSLRKKELTRPMPNSPLFEGRALQASTCLAEADPVYAEESGSDTSYDTYMLTIEDLYLPDGKLERSDADAYSALKIGWAVAAVAAGGLAGVPIAEAVAAAALAVFEVTIDQIDTHDGGIDGTEIEAAFENTRSLLTQTCSIISQVGSFENTVINRFTTVDTTLTTFQANVDTRFDTVDTTLTNFETNVNTRFSTVDATLASFETNVVNRFGEVDEAIAIFRQENRDLLKIIRILLTTPDGRRTGWNTQTCEPGGKCPLVANFPPPL